MYLGILLSDRSLTILYLFESSYFFGTQESDSEAEDSDDQENIRKPRRRATPKLKVKNPQLKKKLQAYVKTIINYVVIPPLHRARVAASLSNRSCHLFVHSTFRKSCEWCSCA